MPQCKECRSRAYREKRYPSCPSCLVHLRLDPNGVCPECNVQLGLRACRLCKDVLPIEVCFYPNKARCKDCIRTGRGGGA